MVDTSNLPPSVRKAIETAPAPPQETQTIGQAYVSRLKASKAKGGGGGGGGGTSAPPQTQEEFLKAKQVKLKAAQALAKQKAKAQAQYSGKERPAETAAILSPLISRLARSRRGTDKEASGFEKLASRRKGELLEKAGKEASMAHFVQREVGFRTPKGETGRAKMTAQVYGERPRPKQAIPESLLFPFGKEAMKEPITKTMQKQKREPSGMGAYTKQAAYPYGMERQRVAVPLSGSSKLDKFEEKTKRMRLFTQTREKIQKDIGYDKGMANIKQFGESVSYTVPFTSPIPRGVVAGATSAAVGGFFYGVGATAQVPEAIGKAKLQIEARYFQPDLDQSLVTKEVRRAQAGARGALSETLTTPAGIGFLLGAGAMAGIAKVSKPPAIIKGYKEKLGAVKEYYKQRTFKPTKYEKLSVKSTARTTDTFVNVVRGEQIIKGQKLNIEGAVKVAAARGKIIYEPASSGVARRGRLGEYTTTGTGATSIIRKHPQVIGKQALKVLGHEAVHMKTPVRILEAPALIPTSISTKIWGASKGKYISYRSQPAEIIAFSLMKLKARQKFTAPLTAFYPTGKFAIRGKGGDVVTTYPRMQLKQKGKPYRKGKGVTYKTAFRESKPFASAGKTAPTVSVWRSNFKSGGVWQKASTVAIGRKLYGSITKRGGKPRYRDASPIIKDAGMFKDLGISIAKPMKYSTLSRAKANAPYQTTIISKTGRTTKFKYLNQLDEVTGIRRLGTPPTIGFSRQRVKGVREPFKQTVAEYRNIGGVKAIWKRGLAQTARFKMTAKEKIFRYGRDIKMEVKGVAKAKLAQTDIAGLQISYYKRGLAMQSLEHKYPYLAAFKKTTTRGMLDTAYPHIKYAIQPIQKSTRKKSYMDLDAGKPIPVTKYKRPPSLETTRKTSFDASIWGVREISRYKPVKQAALATATGAKMAGMTIKLLLEKAKPTKMLRSKRAQQHMVLTESISKGKIATVKAPAQPVEIYQPAMKVGLSSFNILKGTAKPYTISLPIPKTLAIPRTRTISDTKAATRTITRAKPETRTLITPAIKTEIFTEVQPRVRVVPEVRAVTETRATTRTLIRTTTPTRTPTPVITDTTYTPTTPPPDILFPFFPKSKGRGIKSSLDERLVPFKPKYFASIEATYFGIKGKATRQAQITGLGLRPIQV